MKELSIESIRLSLLNYQRVVILREKEADRYLPIWIGPGEADAIAVRLQDVSVARPMTHDLLRNAIEQLGGRVSYIVVNDRVPIFLQGRVLATQSAMAALASSAPVLAAGALSDVTGVKMVMALVSIAIGVAAVANIRPRAIATRVSRSTA